MKTKFTFGHAGCNFGLHKFTAGLPAHCFRSVQVRDRYDGRLGRQEVSYTLMYGFTAANKPMLERIVAPVSA